MKDSQHESTIYSLLERAQELLTSIRSAHEADIFNAKAAAELQDELAATVAQIRLIAAQWNNK